MYAAIFSADVRMGTIGRTLLLKYPLVNTYTYETPFGPLCKSARHTLGLGKRLLLF